mmetsp:Transcript_11899/g.19127  ORF Transcript_11899/g.19127 Transcript_11899/m.19127 type:complete len:340 (+) Transcript_11899:141-1160(+)
MVDPNSLFQSSNFFRSVEATEGRVLAMAASKSAIQTGGGSAIWPFAFISCSCCGVLSATSRRTGAMSASRQTRAMSAPEYPGVASARTSGSTSAAAGVWATPSSNSLRRACRSGRGTRTRFSSLLSKASSRSQGQFVVASTVTGGGMCVAPSSSSSPSSPPPPPPAGPSPFSPPEGRGPWAAAAGATRRRREATPSICTKSSVFRRREASCSPSARRWDTSASISSRKTTAGARWRARLNRHRSSFSDSPRYFETRPAVLTLKKVAPCMPAAALASSVFPVPGGPKSSTPAQGSRIPVNSSGTSMGSTTASRSSRLGASSAATSAKVTPSPRSITSRST